MLHTHFGFFSIILAILFVGGFILLVLAELYRVFIKKKDRKFWNGLGTLLVIFWVGYMARFSMDVTENYRMEKSLSKLTGKGQISSDALYNMFPDLKKGYCEVNESQESQRCVFVMMLESSDEHLAPYVSSETKSILKFGMWPFSVVEEFPPIN